MRNMMGNIWCTLIENMTHVKFRNVAYDGEIGRILKEECVSEYSEGYILVGDEESCFPSSYTKYAERIKALEIRESDIFVATYPKSGTTWTQEMVWLIGNDYNFEGAKRELRKRFPFMEVCTISDLELLRKKIDPADLRECSLDYVDRLESPRFIKTHLPFSLMPDAIKNGSKRPKIIYVVRNPKDVCVSYYHHSQLLEGYTTTLENFSKVFLADRALYGSFWKHAFGYWAHKNEHNYCFIAYEDMKENLPAVIKKVAKFLEKNISDVNMNLLCEHLSFESMKKNEYVNGEDVLVFMKKHNLRTSGGHFIRSGVVGKFKEEMSPDNIKKFDDWIKENTAGTNFHEYYDYTR